MQAIQRNGEIGAGPKAVAGLLPKNGKTPNPFVAILLCRRGFGINALSFFGPPKATKSCCASESFTNAPSLSAGVGNYFGWPNSEATIVRTDFRFSIPVRENSEPSLAIMRRSVGYWLQALKRSSTALRSQTMQPPPFVASACRRPHFRGRSDGGNDVLMDAR
jgi:hypothetical protein